MKEKTDLFLLYFVQTPNHENIEINTFISATKYKLKKIVCFKYK